MEQQQQQQRIHPRILNSIAQLRTDHQGRQWLYIACGCNERRPIDRPSLEHLVTFLRERPSQSDTELTLNGIRLSPDGGLDVLCDFLANDATLTKVKLEHCNFGNERNTTLLLAAFQTSPSVTKLTIDSIHNLRGTAFGACLSALLQNSTHLQGLYCSHCYALGVEGARAFQPGLRSNRHLKVLSLSRCSLQDEGLHLITDALVGNTTLEVLDLDYNRITPNGLSDITRLLESTRLKHINFERNGCYFLDDNAATQRFAHALSLNTFLISIYVCICSGPVATMMFQALESNTTLEQFGVKGQLPNPQQCLDQLVISLPRMKGLKRLCFNHWDLLQNAAFIPALHQNISLEGFECTRDEQLEYFPCRHVHRYPIHHRDAIMAINNILARNRSLRHADSLLALQPRTGRPIASKSGLWHTAFGKMTSGPDNVAHSGASAIFKILQARPAILEQQLRRPALAHGQPESAGQHQQDLPAKNDGSGGGGGTKNSLETDAACGRKRRRL